MKFSHDPKPPPCLGLAECIPVLFGGKRWFCAAYLFGAGQRNATVLPRVDDAVTTAWAQVGAIMTARGFFPGMRSMVGAGVMAAPV
jgi:hypothetical protein